MKNATLLIALAALMVVGCSRKDTPTPEPGPAPVVQGAPAPAPEPAPVPEVDTSKPSDAATLEMPPIPAKGNGGWAVVKLSPTDVSGKMDAAMQGLKNVTCIATLVGTTPLGKIMPSTFPAYIKDAKTFRISYMKLAEGVPLTGIATADGVYTIQMREGGMTDPKKLGSGGAWDRKTLVSGWPANFAEHVFDGLTVRDGLWTALVKGWMSGSGGYTLSLEERVTPYQGRNIKNYRYVAERSTGKDGKKEQVELVVDGQIFLPVTIRTVAYDAKGRETKVQWAGDWKNNQILAPKLFAIKR